MILTLLTNNLEVCDKSQTIYISRLLEYKNKPAKIIYRLHFLRKINDNYRQVLIIDLKWWLNEVF